jgi:anti-anti-sigma regulatory factor
MMNEVRDLGSSTYTVESDADKGLVIIRYRGRVAPADVAACAEEVANALAEMPPGFCLLVDLTDLESMSVACVPYLEEIMRFCDAKQVSAVIRVVPDARRDIGLQIMSRFHYRRTVEFVTCKSLDEAAAMLTDAEHEPANAEVSSDTQHD